MGDYEFLQAAARVKSLGELTQVVGETLQAAGCPRFALGLIPDATIRRSTIILENLGPAWWRVADDSRHAARAEFIGLVRSSPVPFEMPTSFHQSVNARLMAAGLYHTVEPSFVVPLTTREGIAYVLTSRLVLDAVPPEGLQHIRTIAAAGLLHWHRIIGAGRDGNITTREREVLGRVAAGDPSAAIAAALGITERTVIAHISSAMRKLDARNRTAAVVNAMKRGLIDV